MLQCCRKITVVQNKKNLGVPKAFNQGIKIAIRNRSFHFLITNNDIVFNPLTVDRMLSTVRNSKYKYITAFDQKRNQNNIKPGTYMWEGLCNSCFVISQELIDRVGFYDEHFGLGNDEDRDYLHRMGLLGEEARAYTLAVVDHNHGWTQRIVGSNSVQRLQANREYLNKKHGICVAW